MTFRFKKKMISWHTMEEPVVGVITGAPRAAVHVTGAVGDED